MGVVDEAIHNRIGNGWISDIFVPVFNRQLAGNEGGGMSVSVLNDLQQIPSLRGLGSPIKRHLSREKSIL